MGRLLTFVFSLAYPSSRSWIAQVCKEDTRSSGTHDLRWGESESGSWIKLVL